MVYGDAACHTRALRLCDRIARVFGCDALSVAGWSLAELNDLDIMHPAVKAASEADVILVSLADGDELPTHLSVWIDAWLPGRGHRPGALVAMIGAPGLPRSHLTEAEFYLHAVACRWGMDFLPLDHVCANYFPITFHWPPASQPEVTDLRPRVRMKIEPELETEPEV